MKLIALVTALGIGTALIGCKKSGSSVSQDDLRKDSTLIYARDIYLWYQNIPSTFDARKYADPNEVLEGIRPYSIQSGFTQPVDRWSFAVTEKQWDDISGGIAADFGLGIFFNAEGDLRVSYVEKASPAGKAGIKRGWRLKKVNNITNIVTSNAEAIVKAVYQSNAVTILLERAGQADTTLNLTAATYQENPIILDSVYTTNATKTGYFAYNSFLGDQNVIKQEFARIFNKFNAAGVSDVIIDLRYNGGGYVALQDELANYLVPNAGNGGVAEKQEFNNKYSEYNKTVLFKKKGSLNLSRLFVIVTRNTASASELLINSLKPYLDVQLVGPTATHGKAVGYFEVPVMGWATFPVSFRTLNKNNQGNYFNGLPLNYQMRDGLDVDWGQDTEACLRTVLNYIKVGAYAKTFAVESRAGLAPVVFEGNDQLGANRFKGAVSDPRSFGIHL